MSLHDIDKVKHFTDKELDKFLVFCLLDRAMPYTRVCEIFDELDSYDMTIRDSIKNKTLNEIREILKKNGHRFPNQTSTYIKEFGNSTIDLRNISRDELISKVRGIGLKLASMFLRNTRGDKVAVIDRHIRNWLKEQGIEEQSYKKLEIEFLKKCEELNKNPYELDIEIWQLRRRK